MRVKERLQDTRLYRKFRRLHKRRQARKVPPHKATLGTVLEFQSVPVVPYQELQDWRFGRSFHKGGPIWPNWNKQVEARHCRNGLPIDVRPDRPTKIEREIATPALWCGPVCSHFGHQIADFSTRLLQAQTVHPEARLLFSTKDTAQYRSYAQPDTFFQAILAWFGIDINQIELVMEPTLVRELWVAPQAEQLDNYGPAPDYLDLLDELVTRRVAQKALRRPRQKAVFVSRAGVSTRFAGEAYIEQIMRAGDIRVIRPETLPLEEQLAEYLAAELLIFSEGSAFHAMQLLGRCNNQIHILNRRPGKRIAQNLLNVRTRSLTYLEVSRGTVCGRWPNGRLKRSVGISILNEAAMVDYLKTLDPSLAKRWDRAVYLSARDKDVRNWLRAEANCGLATIASTKETIIQKLQAAGLSHLVSEAEAIFTA